ASTQTPAEMVLFSDLLQRDHSVHSPAPSPRTIPGIPLASITNSSSGSTLTSTSSPPAPDPDVIARMIQADPSLQNVDPTLIAMGIPEGDQRRVTTAPPIERSSDRTILSTNHSKRRWQEVVTPLSFNVNPANKKPRKQRKD